MADSEKEEAVNLQMEFEWVLHEEVHAVLTQLHTILLECVRRFPVPLCGNDGPQKQDKFVLTAPPEQLKCVVTLTGDSITHADINFKVQRQQNIIHRTTIQNDSPWKLQQVQDAGNHLQQALLYIENVDKDYTFKSSEEVLHVLSSILGCLQRGRSSLVVPRKRTIDDLMKSRNMKSLAPSLPEDLAISFYIQSHKLIFAVYQLSNVHGTMKFDSHQAECSIPWLNEVLVLFTVALQLCQQLKDKVMLYTTFFDPAFGPPFSVLQVESFPDLTYGLIIPSSGMYLSPHYTTSAELMCKHSEYDSSSLEVNPAQSVATKEIHFSRKQA